MGPKKYIFAATQAAEMGRVFNLPRKLTPGKRGWYPPQLLNIFDLIF